MKFKLFLIPALIIFSCSGEKKSDKNATEKTKDPNKVSAPTDDNRTSAENIIIGNIEFATENLSVTTYRNEDPIPRAKNSEEWKKYSENGEGCYAWPEFKEEAAVEGLVYNGFCISDPRGLAPVGWKIPTRDDWESAIKSLGDPKLVGKNFKSTESWKAKGDNKTGFNSLPLGFFAGDFNHELECIYYWTSSVPAPEYHYHFDLSGDNDEFSSWYDHDSWGMYVRCVRA